MSLTALFALCGGAAAQQMAVADVEALPGETVSLTLQIDTDGGSYTGLEFDILFPQSGFSTTANAVTSSGWDGAFTIGDVGTLEENTARCGLLSFSDTEIPYEGLHELGTIEFTFSDALHIGSYTVTLTNMTLIGLGDERVSVADVNFNLNVVNVHSVVLDETSTTAPVPATGVNVRVRRTIKAGEWSTICLPFSMTASQVTAAFGADVKIGDFKGCDVDDETGNVKVKFSEVTAMEANHPYIIKVGSDVAEFTVDGVDIEPDDAEVKLDKSGRRYNSFIGNYVSGTVLEDGTMFLSGNSFNFSSGQTKIKGFRGYFDFAAADVYYEARFILAFDNDVTGVSEIERLGNEEMERLFGLGGQRVSKPGKGVYVRGGKKVIIK